MQTDYQRGMVDAAKIIKESPAACCPAIDNVRYVNQICDKIIAENTPKKSEAEKFYEKYNGKMVICQGATYIVQDMDKYECFHLEMGGRKVCCALSDITHVYEAVRLDGAGA